MNLTSDEKEKLLLAGQFGSKDESLWNQVCDEVKLARDGQYPSDWTRLVYLRELFQSKGEVNVEPPKLSFISIRKNTE